MGKDIKISGKLLDLNTHRQVAKVGMSVTLASVCLSALFMKNRSVKKFHVVSGIAFTCFAIYHVVIYYNGIFKIMILKEKTTTKME